LGAGYLGRWLKAAELGERFDLQKKAEFVGGQIRRKEKQAALAKPEKPASEKFLIASAETPAAKKSKNRKCVVGPGGLEPPTRPL
jgi:hypothetical protein